jgi:hypothetical protein
MGLDMEVETELSVELDIEELNMGLLQLSEGILAETKGRGNRPRVKRGTSADHPITTDSSMT